MRVRLEASYMNYIVAPAWLDQFVRASHVSRSGAQGQFYREVARGVFHRVTEGVYLPAATWAALDSDERHLARIHAVALAVGPGMLFSHLSAAALWRLPIVGLWPELPEVTVGATQGGQSRRTFTARKYPLPPTDARIDGLRVTSLARTVVDVARTSRMSTAVAMADYALAIKPARSTKIESATVMFSELLQEISEVESSRGMRRCRDAIGLADGRSGSAGESLSRVGMHVLGLPAPELQHPVYDRDGLIGIADFWWPEFNLLGEFDGFGKYVREALRPGMAVADVVVAEKIREDRMRATGPGMTRWGWKTARSLPALAAHLRSAGLR